MDNTRWIKQHHINVANIAKNESHITEQEKEKPKPKRGPFRPWLWEVLSLLFALALLVATIVIPARYNNKVQQSWPYDISLNTIIAILSTFMRASMLLVLAELLGQMGWQDLRRPRPVSDLHHFDNASRGIWGAFMLLWSVPPRFVSIVAALLVIISPAVTPFAQQAVATIPCSRAAPEKQAWLPISHHMPGTDAILAISPASYDINSGMKVDMMSGLVNPKGKDTAIEGTCSTGNCTFPVNSRGVSHSSIAMCSSCIDTTELIKLKVGKDAQGTNGYFGKPYNFTLPNGQWIAINLSSDLQTETGELGWALGIANSSFAAVADIAITNVTVLRFDKSACNSTGSANLTCPMDRLNSELPEGMRNQNARATSCALYPCVKQYKARIEAGSLYEEIVDTKALFYEGKMDPWTSSGPNSSLRPNRTYVPPACVIEGKEYNLENFTQSGDPKFPGQNLIIQGTNYTIPNQCVYSLTFGYARALARYTEELFDKGVCAFSILGNRPLDCLNQWWLAPLYNTSFTDMDRTFNQFTTAITNNFRKQRSPGSRLPQTDQVVGEATEMAICTVFDWRWVMMPASLMAITTGLLIYAVVQSFMNPGVPVWKTSILPLLFYGPNVLNDRTNETDLDELQKEAGKVKVKFQDQDGVRLREVDTTSTES
ncbi:hypothetical protein F53441_10759 [Fusarium austroafricanum]|uniref:Uncharacterized protein n=1 Tax=Fusarium austroafricanum TaxID=2364996 RepID=A0A8H4K8V2_9HYPO|nr:hypothetical protein F53441_10759 [Fusarium austroafricanum]